MRGAQALARHGLSGLYSASLFRYSDDAITHIAEGLELGRSFVVPDYWGSRSLDYLWQGIGAYLQCRPGIRYLFGAVSISAALPPVPPAWPSPTGRSSTSPRRRASVNWMQALHSMC
ncbi:hypothetical protein G6F22_018736 [Rhizopus arrhizus]|nr:hypothetical protein G6F22_018736 [Rhizopus arrhizus]